MARMLTSAYSNVRKSRTCPAVPSTLSARVREAAGPARWQDEQRELVVQSVEAARKSARADEV